MTYQLSHTDIYVEVDDLHCVNNPAIQQAWDDIRRTILVGRGGLREFVPAGERSAVIKV